MGRRGVGRLAQLVCCVAVAVWLTPAARCDEWISWAGPNLDLTVSDTGVFDGSRFGLERVWTRTLGSAYSGMVLADGKLVTFLSDGTSDHLVALDAATGEEIWRTAVGAMYRGHNGSHDGPNGTPLIYDGRVYGVGPFGRLVALRLDDGREVFAHDLVESFGASTPDHGFTTAPTVVGGVLLVQTGGGEGRSISGFDPVSGELLWQTGDGPVSYQSPIGLTVDGRTLLLAVFDDRALGIEPATGEILFRHAFPRQTRYVAAQPIPLGDDQILLTGRRGAGLYRVEPTNDGLVLGEVWTTRALRGSYTVPVPHEGHVYGYSGNFLTCVDAATGETVWKSRPPGRGTLIVLDGHLVILADSGDLVVAAASPDGYDETSRRKVLDDGSLTAPSFAEGRIYVRNLTQGAAVRVVAAKSGGETTAEKTAGGAPSLEVEVHGSLARFVEEVEALPDTDARKAMVDDFLDAQKRFPIIEGDRWVHFVYRGEVDDLALVGNFFRESEGEKVMGRVEGTDFYYRSVEVTPAAHYTYRFQVFGEPLPDPLNPRTVEGDRALWSELAMPGWPEPTHLREFDGPRGRLTTWTWESNVLGNTRDVRVYLPAGYDEVDTRYPLLVVNLGDEALRRGSMANSLDHLMGTDASPIVVAFVPARSTAEYLSVAGLERLTEAMVSEMLPHLASDYRLLREPGSHGIMGTGFGASHAVFAALKHPEIFGHVAAQSYFAYRSRDLVGEWVDGGRARGLHAFVELNSNDLRFGPWADAEEESRELVARLLEGGADVTTVEVADGADWSSWRSRTDVILSTLFPIPGDGASDQ